MSEMALSVVPRRARRVINSMLASKTITPQGLNWLVAATDPFHDEPLNIDGYPDVTTSRCISQCINQTVTISVPSGITGSWDFHVFFNPSSPPLVFGAPGTGVSDLRYLRTLVDPAGNIVQSGTGLPLYSGVTGIAIPTGLDWQSTALGASFPQVSIPSQYTGGYHRVVAAAFEVVNTTAELYKGGTVTVYRSPSYSSSCHTLGYNTGPVLTNFGNMPPTNPSDAALFPNSRTWGAEEGCYVVATQNSMDNNFVSPLPSRSTGLILGLNNTALTTGTGQRICYLPVAGLALFPPQNQPYPFDCCGAVFSGLQNSSTLQLTSRYYIERLPAISDPNLLVLAREPCPYDPVIMELYSRVIRELPVGVRVADNPLGEWFFDILQALAGIAPAVGTALTPILGPAGPMIGTAIGTAGTAALQARKAKQQAKKKS